LHEAKLDVLALSCSSNIRYLCGFGGSAGVLLITDQDAVLFTDGRYTDQAREEMLGKQTRVRIVRKSALGAAAEWISTRKSARKVGFEATHLTVAERRMLAAAVGGRAKLVEAPAIIEKMRMVKDREEIAKIREACQLAAGLFPSLLNVVRPGLSESEVAGDLEFRARKAGADQMAFPTIVAGGIRSSLPHGRASAAPIPVKGFVVCDFGVILAGYCSDMTRTLHIGRPQAEAKLGYEAVREAQRAAIAAVTPGATAGEVDQAARKVLRGKGLGKFFTHSTGHGVGLDIHEAPRLATGQTERLQPGMVITVEPGIYLSGKWGVRIEDTVVVTEKGCEILTACRKDLITV
jgi:Xaa-Pro aminopeptidase